MRLVLAILLLTSAGAVRAADAPKLVDAERTRAVGTTLFTWTDDARNDPRTGASRRLIVQLWYPAVRARGAAAPYVFDLNVLRTDLRTRLRFDDPDVLSTVATHALLDAAPDGRRLPVVLFSHGFGTPRAIYTSFVRSLAAAGYVVAAIDHPGMGVVALDGRLVTPYSPPLPPAQLRADQQFVLDQLTALAAGDARFRGVLHLERVVLIGHSRGFVSATCAADARIDACVNLNGAAAAEENANGLGIPLLTVRATRGDRTEAQTAIYAAMRAPAFDIVVEGSHHSSVTDRDLFAAHARATAERRLRVVNAVVAAFLDEILRDRPDALRRVAGELGEVTLTVHPRSRD